MTITFIIGKNLENLVQIPENGCQYGFTDTYVCIYMVYYKMFRFSILTRIISITNIQSWNGDIRITLLVIYT